jgi:hypothetical protein
VVARSAIELSDLAGKGPPCTISWRDGWEWLKTVSFYPLMCMQTILFQVATARKGNIGTHSRSHDITRTTQGIKHMDDRILGAYFPEPCADGADGVMDVSAKQPRRGHLPVSFACPDTVFPNARLFLAQCVRKQRPKLSYRNIVFQNLVVFLPGIYGTRLHASQGSPSTILDTSDFARPDQGDTHYSDAPNQGGMIDR